MNDWFGVSKGSMFGGKVGFDVLIGQLIGVIEKYVKAWKYCGPSQQADSNSVDVFLSYAVCDTGELCTKCQTCHEFLFLSREQAWW